MGLPLEGMKTRFAATVSCLLYLLQFSPAGPFCDISTSQPMTPSAKLDPLLIEGSKITFVT